MQGEQYAAAKARETRIDVYSQWLATAEREP